MAAHLNNANSSKGFSELSRRLRKLNDTACCIQKNTEEACCPETNQLLTDILAVLNEPRFDPLLLCNPTDNSIVIGVFDEETTILVYQNPDGTPYTGPTPVKCDDKELESDPIDYCANGVAYTKWVVKDNGEPTGVVFWTDETDAIVPAPTDAVKGDCEVCECVGEDFFTTVTADGTTTIPFEAKNISITPNGKCCNATITFNGPNYTGTPITIRSGRAYSFNKSCPLINEIIITGLNCPDGLDIYAEVETQTCN